MSSGDKPQYLSQSQLARHFDVSRTAIANWLMRWPCDDEMLPTPEPDAFVDHRPLWLQESLPKWDAWRERHMHRWGNRMEHPRPNRRKVHVAEKVTVGVDEVAAAQNQENLHRMLRALHARAGWPMPGDLARRTGMFPETIRKALRTDGLPERQTVITLTAVLGGDPDVASDLWARSRPSRKIDGGWLSRVLSVAHGKVLYLAAIGCTAEDTAQQLGWTVEGVREYWEDITERLRVQSMDEAVWVAVEAGYLTTGPDGVIGLTTRTGGRGKQGGEHGYLIYKVAHELRTRLANADPGSHVGTIDRLRQEFKTSATTIFYALKILKAEGVITGGGKGHPYIVANR